jgi:hypothetical protein
MSVRAAVVVGITTLLCASAIAEPPASSNAKKRRGTFAAYIDPAAPADPPRPPPPRPEVEATALSIVVLIDRSAGITGSKLDSAKQAISAIDSMTWGDDLIAVLAFDESVDYVMKPTWAGDPRLRKSVKKLKASKDAANLLQALDEVCWYIQAAPGRRIVVLVADGGVRDDELDDAMRLVSGANVQTIVVGMAGGDPAALRRLAREIDAPFVMLDGLRGHDWLAGEIWHQHYIAPPTASGRTTSGRWTIGSARSASPPPP